MSYALRIDKQAAKTLKSLDQPTIKRLLARLTEQTKNTFDHRTSSPLEMEPSVRRSRVGYYRVFYEVVDAEHVIAIVAIKPAAGLPQAMTGQATRGAHLHPHRRDTTQP
jgi:mRNA-degrading endonuclease RelE of RelBE toxin-antitoxin system